MSTLSEIERFIDQYDGTAIGESVRNMVVNETDPEYICEYAGIPYDPDEE